MYRPLVTYDLNPSQYELHAVIGELPSDLLTLLTLSFRNVLQWSRHSPLGQAPPHAEATCGEENPLGCSDGRHEIP